MRSLLGTKGRSAFDPAARIRIRRGAGRAHEIEDILAIARKRDEELAKLVKPPSMRGEADPYKHPEEDDDDDFDDDDVEVEDWDDDEEA